MRLLARDTEGRLHAISVSDIYYDEDDRELNVNSVADEYYSVSDMDKYTAEELIRTLVSDGKAELISKYRIE